VPDLPVEPINWALALLPLVVLLILLAGLHWKAPEAGPIGLFLAAGIALFAFEAPLEVLAVAAGKGVWDAIFILYVIWPALLLYRVVDRAGAFEALHAGIERFSRNELFLVLAFGWVFVSFLQGITGFGVPIAVVAPLLIGLGVRPLYAVVIPLIGHAWANLCGTLAVPTEVVRAALGIPSDVRVVACNALEKDSVKGVLLELLTAVLEDVDATEHATAV
jgi:lactate permease